MGMEANQAPSGPPVAHPEQVVIAGVMRDLFDRVTAVVFTLGLVSIGATLIRGGAHGLSVSSWLDMGIYLTAAALLLLRRRLSPRTLFWLITALMWLDGVMSLALLGLASAGLFILCAVSAMIGIFYGLRAGLAAVASAVFVVALLGTGASFGVLPGAPDPGRLVTAPGTWIVQGATFAFYTVSVIFAAYGMQSKLGQSLAALAERSAETERANRQLEREIASREQSERERHAIEESRRELEARLHQTEKLQAIGQLAGGVAHDFNNQLSAITGFATLMLRSNTLPEPLRGNADGILAAARHSADLTNKLLAFARRDPITKDPVDMHEVLKDVLAMLEVGCDKRIEIHSALAAEAYVVLGDRSQLVSVLLNLGLNARDAMPQGGSLTFSTRTVDIEPHSERARALHLGAGRHIELAVTDTGVGMDAALAKRVFEPFFTTKPLGAGTGMGLAAAYGTLKTHMGGIEVESAPGAGSTFRVLLPLALDAARPRTQAAPAPLARGAGSVLVIDDEPAVSTVCLELLRELGYSGVCYTTPRAALEYFSAHNREIDLVVLDMVMPGLDGRDVFRSLRAIDPRVRILLTSGYSWQTSAHELLAQGAAGFLQKPYSIEGLAAAVSNALGATQQNLTDRSRSAP